MNFQIGKYFQTSSCAARRKYRACVITERPTSITHAVCDDNDVKKNICLHTPLKMLHIRSSVHIYSHTRLYQLFSSSLWYGIFIINVPQRYSVLGWQWSSCGVLFRDTGFSGHTLSPCIFRLLPHAWIRQGITLPCPHTFTQKLVHFVITVGVYIALF